MNDLAWEILNHCRKILYYGKGTKLGRGDVYVINVCNIGVFYKNVHVCLCNMIETLYCACNLQV